MQIENHFLEISERLTRIEHHLINLKDIRPLNNNANDGDVRMNTDELCNHYPNQGFVRYLVYGLVSKNKIPFHKNGTRLFFLKSEIDQWLKDGRKMEVCHE